MFYFFFVKILLTLVIIFLYQGTFGAGGGGVVGVDVELGVEGVDVDSLFAFSSKRFFAKSVELMY